MRRAVGLLTLFALATVMSGASNVGTPTERPLSARALDNVSAFTRLLGVVRYFHPSDQAAGADWNAFAAHGMGVVEDAADADELATRLAGLFAPIAPTARIFPTGHRPLDLRVPRPASHAPLTLTMWEHQGLGLGTDAPAGRSVYTSRRRTAVLPARGLPASYVSPEAAYASALTGGVSCWVPMSVYADAGGSFPRVARAATPEQAPMTPRDRRMRLATVALAWNAYQHFYPYFDTVKVDWPAAMRRALIHAATDADAAAFSRTLQRLVAELQDSHGYVRAPLGAPMLIPPVRLDLVEGRLLVVALGGQTGEPIAVGDEVVRVGGRPALEALADEAAHHSGATPQWKRHLALENLLAGLSTERVTLRLRRPDGAECDVPLARWVSPWRAPTYPTLPPKVHALRPGVLYVDLDRVSEADFEAALPRLQAARGIVFDMRGYPKLDFAPVLARLTDRPLRTARFLMPRVRFPDGRGVTYTDMSWPIPPQAPRLKARTAFITGPGAVSAAESLLGIVQHDRLGAIVGETTAGSNGNMNWVALPGGYAVSFTGLRVLRHDGKPHHGVGIVPDVVVPVTRQAVLDGRDEQLQAALKLVAGP